MLSRSVLKEVSNGPKRTDVTSMSIGKQPFAYVISHHDVFIAQIKVPNRGLGFDL